MAQQSPKHVDVLIIGVGQAGKPLAQAFAQKDRSVALIERKFVGGTCINYGCTPTKTLLASAQMAHQARRSTDYGIKTGAVTVDFRAVIERKNGVVEKFRKGIEESLGKAANIDLIQGEARFTGPSEVTVSNDNGQTQPITADLIFINAGTHPKQPDIPGLDTVNWLTSTTLMDIDTLPDHLLIVGGGYVGVEFSQMFRRFGSRVTMLVRGGQLLPREDPDVAEELAKILTDEGIKIQYNTGIQTVNESRSGGVTVKFSANGKASQVSGSHLLVAVGSTPNTDALNLSAAGVATDEHGFIKVSDQLETSQSGIYALGDIKGGPAFTHIAYDDYRVVKQNLLENGKASTAGRPLPYTVFTDPQLGRIGLNEQEAKQLGKAVKVATMPMSWVGRAIETGHTKGFMKVLVDAESDQILGAAILGMEGGELMSILQIAMMGQLPYQRLRDAIFAHPTLAESLNNLFTKLD
ncbi:MAG: mercuric reductase [Rudanella sp.]|nr:mercuric reductase [Rudanella sp.]